MSFEGDEAFRLIGAHRRKSLEELLKQERSKLEYRMNPREEGNGAFADILSLSSCSRSRVLFVERDKSNKRKASCFFKSLQVF